MLGCLISCGNKIRKVKSMELFCVNLITIHPKVYLNSTIYENKQRIIFGHYNSVCSSNTKDGPFALTA